MATPTSHAKCVGSRFLWVFVVVAVLVMAYLGIESIIAKTHWDHVVTAYSAIKEAQRLMHNHPQVASHLVKEAALALEISVPKGPLVNQITQIHQQAVRRLATPSFLVWGPNGSALLPPLLLIFAAVLYWTKDREVERLGQERHLLRNQLLAITGGWGSLPSRAGTQAVVEHVLQQLREHTAVRAASVYRIDEDSRDDAVIPYCEVGIGVKLGDQPIPRLFLHPNFGLLGRTVSEGTARYCGEAGSEGMILPGIRLPRVALYPLRYQGSLWGVLAVQGTEPGWHARHGDLLDVIVQEISILLVNAALAERAQKTAMYQELARMRSEILANVSHELRTPLGLIKGYVDMLAADADDLPSPERREFVQIVAEETLALEQLIDNLLYMSRIETVGVHLECSHFSARGWVDKLTRRFSHEAKSRLTVEVYGSGIMYGDRRQLAHVLDNVIQNGLKYSEGIIDIEIDDDDISSVITVRDRGPGVSPDKIAHIFERFYRTPEQAQSPIRGSGLGLSIARRVVEEHGGTIEAVNHPDNGLVVTIRIPNGTQRPQEANHDRKLGDVGPHY